MSEGREGKGMRKERDYRGKVAEEVEEGKKK